MKLIHISDTHNYHSQLEIPECDVLIHSGDIGGKTNLHELTEFLIWFEKQPAKKKIFCGGNHDHILSRERLNKDMNSILNMISLQQYEDGMNLIKSYNVIYLMNSEYTFEGIKFWGSPYSLSFYRDRWVFNADKGKEINKVWSKIPSDVDVLVTHTPPYGVLDLIEEKQKQTPDEDIHRGCQDLMNVIKKRLINLKLHTFGHIHSNYGVIKKSISNTRSVLFSNGAVLNNNYKFEIKQPLIINI